MDDPVLQPVLDEFGEAMADQVYFYFMKSISDKIVLGLDRIW